MKTSLLGIPILLVSSSRLQGRLSCEHGFINAGIQNTAIKLKQPRCTAHTFARHAGTNDKSVFRSVTVVTILFRIKKSSLKIEELRLELDFMAPEKLIFLTLSVALLQF